MPQRAPISLGWTVATIAISVAVAVGGALAGRAIDSVMDAREESIRMYEAISSLAQRVTTIEARLLRLERPPASSAGIRVPRVTSDWPRSRP